MTDGDMLNKDEPASSGKTASVRDPSQVDQSSTRWRMIKRALLFVCLALLLILLGYIWGERGPSIGNEKGAVSHLLFPTRLYPTVGIDSYSQLSYLNPVRTLDLDPPTDSEMALYSELVRDHPKDPSAHRLKGLALLRKGDTDKAIDEFKVAVRLAPDDPSINNDLGVALYLQGNHIAGLEQLKYAAKLDPKQKSHANGNEVAVEFEENYKKALAVEREKSRLERMSSVEHVEATKE